MLYTSVGVLIHVGSVILVFQTSVVVYNNVQFHNFQNKKYVVLALSVGTKTSVQNCLVCNDSVVKDV